MLGFVEFYDSFIKWAKDSPAANLISIFGTVGLIGAFGAARTWYQMRRASDEGIIVALRAEVEYHKSRHQVAESRRLESEQRCAALPETALKKAEGSAWMEMRIRPITSSPIGS